MQKKGKNAEMHEIHVQFENSCKKKDKNVFSILKFIQKKTFFCLSQNLNLSHIIVNNYKKKYKDKA